MPRITTVTRKTRETDITLTLSLEGGDISVYTGIGFFDHMLTSFALHGGFGLEMRMKGDLHVDGHHTVEDTGIALGQAFRRALGGGEGIERFGQAAVPMDESLARAAADAGGRAYLRYDAPAAQEHVGGFDTCLSEEFWRGFCTQAGITLHVEAFGANTHHMLEAVFKACARALKDAVRVTGTGIPSTKGRLSEEAPC